MPATSEPVQQDPSSRRIRAQSEPTMNPVVIAVLLVVVAGPALAASLPVGAPHGSDIVTPVRLLSCGSRGGPGWARAGWPVCWAQDPEPDLWRATRDALHSRGCDGVRNGRGN